MPTEPSVKRAVAFVDGQNLYYSAREAFGYPFPNYDIQALAAKVCAAQAWTLTQTHFYTGIPDPADNPFWNRFWSGKLAVMGRQGVRVFTRPLRYRNKTVRLPNLKDFGAMAGKEHSFLAGEEKGVDVRIALDTIRMAHRKEYDVALIFSQDQDLSEVVDEIRTVSREQNRWIKAACAFPFSPASRNRRGINGSDWLRIDRTAYDACLDTRDYR